MKHMTNGGKGRREEEIEKMSKILREYFQSSSNTDLNVININMCC